MLPRRREAWSLLAASCLHAGAIAALRVSLEQPSEAPPTKALLADDLAWDIDLTVAHPNPNPSPTPETPTQETSRSISSRQNPRRPAPRPQAPEPSHDIASTRSDARPVEGEVEALRAEAVAPRPIDLGIGIGAEAWRRWAALPQEGAAKASEPSRARSNRFHVYRAPPASTTGGLQEGLEARDRELGLGPSGRVLSALHDAAHEATAPAAGTATFEVTVLRTGSVQVTLGAATGPPEAWKQVATRIAERLRAAPPRIPSRRRGARLVVELVADWTMPNGTKMSSLEAPHLDAVPPKFRSTEDEQRQLELDNPTAKNDADEASLPPIKLDLPGVYLVERGKVCSYRLGLSALGPILQGGCDPGHLGAKPRRMVHARVLEETSF